jgi:cold shock CspA family protein
VQGVIKAFDPSSGDGVVIAESDLREYDLAPDALGTSLFRMLRQGQRVIFDLDERRLATRLRLGSEVDMGTPGYQIAHPDDPQHPQEGPDQRPLPPVS